jgi:signal transduction histidine kinase
MPETAEEVTFGLLRGRVMRMENLINGVLDYSRIGKVLIENQLTDLKKCYIRLLKQLYPLKGMSFILRDNIPEIKIARILSADFH